MASEREVAREHGLDPSMDLGQACADFYVLEHLTNELFPYSQDARIPTGLIPDTFGTGSRRERRGYAAQRAMADLEASLADTFVRYITLAVGGEVRYFMSRRQEVKVGVVREKPPASPDGTYPAPNLPYPKPEDRFSVDWVDDDGILSLPKERTLYEYLSNCEWVNTGPERAVAWDSWWRTSLDDHRWGSKACRLSLSSSLEAVAEVFEHPIWYTSYYPQLHRWYDLEGVEPHTGTVLLLDEKGQPALPNNVASGCSVGGKNWALPARMTSDYLRGQMTTRTYIDRCWSLQHNGGSLFNKLFNVSGLSAVLVTQYEEEDGYHKLPVQCSSYVRSLWTEHLYETQPDSWYTRLPIVGKSGPQGFEDWVNKHGSGCENCYQYYVETGDVDNCGGGDWTCCYYFSKYGIEGDGGGDSEPCDHCGCYYDNDGGQCCACGETDEVKE